MNNWRPRSTSAGDARSPSNAKRPRLRRNLIWSRWSCHWADVLSRPRNIVNIFAAFIVVAGLAPLPSSSLESFGRGSSAFSRRRLVLATTINNNQYALWNVVRCAACIHWMHFQHFVAYLINAWEYFRSTLCVELRINVSLHDAFLPDHCGGMCADRFAVFHHKNPKMLINDHIFRFWVENSCARVCARNWFLRRCFTQKSLFGSYVGTPVPSWASSIFPSFWITSSGFFFKIKLWREEGIINYSKLWFGHMDN